MHKMEPPPEVAPQEMDTLVAFTEGFSGSDLSVLVAEAIMGPVNPLAPPTPLAPSHLPLYRQCESSAWSQDLVLHPLRLRTVAASITQV